eukprot:10732-Eustigmatos_ZCMA.PRE.1
MRQTKDEKMRQRALVAVGRLGAKAAQVETVRVLVDVMVHAEEPVDRRLAAWALGKIGRRA